MSDPQTTESPRVPVRRADDRAYDVDPGKGWILFAGIMLAFIGVLNLVYGIAAIGNSRFYVRDVEFVLGDLRTWGWLLTIVGVVQICAAIGIWMTTEWGRWLGIAFAMINGFIQFLAMPAHPLWAVMVLMIDVIIVFGLLTYGGRDRHSLA